MYGQRESFNCNSDIEAKPTLRQVLVHKESQSGSKISLNQDGCSLRTNGCLVSRQSEPETICIPSTWQEKKSDLSRHLYVHHSPPLAHCNPFLHRHSFLPRFKSACQSLWDIQKVSRTNYTVTTAGHRAQINTCQLLSPMSSLSFSALKELSSPSLDHYDHSQGGALECTHFLTEMGKGELKCIAWMMQISLFAPVVYQLSSIFIVKGMNHNESKTVYSPGSWWCFFLTS